MTNTQDDDFLEHYGVKGMKWGVRNEDGSSRISLSPGQKQLAVALISTGAAVAGAMLAGPIGGMAVGGISRAAGQAFTTTSTSRTTEAVNLDPAYIR